VKSQVKPNVKVMVECGFDRSIAIVGAGAAAEELNQKYGDSIDPADCVAAVKKFFATDVDIQCRYCGWREKGTKFCTQHQTETNDGQQCELFRHVFSVVR